VIRADWDSWKAAPTPAKLAALVADNEPLVEKIAAFLMAKIEGASESMRDDLLQAGRIGLLRAIRTWNPNGAKFSPFAWGWVRHEMQTAMAHGACPVSYPRRLLFATNGQAKAASHYAQHGVDPAPETIGITKGLAERVQKSQARFVPVSAAENMATQDEEIEADIDRQRDMKSLKAFLAKLTEEERKRFWTGKDDKLTARAKVFVGGRRVSR